MKGSEESSWSGSPGVAVPTAVNGFNNISNSSSSSLLSVVDLILHYRQIRLALAIPSDYSSVLELLKDTFLMSISFAPETFDLQSPVELALAYIEFLISQDEILPSILAVVVQSFDRHFLLDKTDIHCLVMQLTPCRQTQQRWLRVYYHAIGASGDNYSLQNDQQAGAPSAFLRHVESKQFRMVGIFGGQGDLSLTCMLELSDLYSTYQHMLRPLIRVLGALLDQLSQRPETQSFYRGQTFNLEGWLSGLTPVPPTDFIAKAPVSMPLIGILSLSRYSVVCHVLKLTPGELRSSFEATTGHSQGLLVSIAISMSDSWEAFHDNSRLAVEALFWLGWEAHCRAPRVACRFIDHQHSEDQTDSSYMLSVRGIERTKLDTILLRLNRTVHGSSQLHVALVNSRDQFVVAGPVDSLAHLDSYLESIKGSDDQSKVPFSRRKLSVSHVFLPISTPFHTPYLKKAAEETKKRLAGRKISSDQLMIPVYHTSTGQDLREHSPDVSMLDIAIDAIAHEICDWTITLASLTKCRDRPCRISHVLVFDRGGLGSLVKKMTEGLGIRIIQGADLSSHDAEIGTMQDLFSPRLLDTSTKLQTWSQRFRPKLVAGLTGGLETRLSRLLGTPPIMVAGMTPTTVHWDFVSAIMNAGYHVELAGGGYHAAADMEAAINKLVEVIPPGRGITCNLIYANPRAMGWQIPLLRRLSNNNIPIDGLTIGAGVPSLDVVTDYIRNLNLRHISFKPGSTSGIRQVIAIAKEHPEFPIILQWTGGRGGGHHSFEDFHSPILSTYGLIRQQQNIYLVAGSGLGDGDSIYPYLTGSWSTNMGYAPMPFDGVLLGSRMMVARESHTSPPAKELIIQTEGLQDSEWENTYTGASGGIITVRSEMGEPIHKLATRGVLLWAEMDKAVFSLPPKKRLPYLMKHRDEIINRLNRDFAKPWFGKNRKGDVVDLADMTYIEVLIRMAELMYVKHQRRWIDASYVELTMRFALRALERSQNNCSVISDISEETLTEDPEGFIRAFANACPAADEVLNPEDASFFIHQMKRPGQKPVNFIPILNEDFEFFFKKDSLWQSEYIDAVLDQDAERVCILHGPVAAPYSKTGEDSAKDILDSITQSLVDRIQQDLLSMEFASPPESGLVTPDSWSSVSAAGKDVFTEEMSLSPSVTLSHSHNDNPSLSAIVTLRNCRMAPAWVRAILGDKTIIQNRVRQSNPFRQFIESCPEATVHFNPDRSEILILHQGPHAATSSLKITSHNGVDITVELQTQSAPVPLQLCYNYDPSRRPFGLSEVMTHRNQHIKSFYSNLWIGEDANPQMTVHDKYYGREMTLTTELLEGLIEVTGAAFPDHRVMFASTDALPISIGIVLAWEVVSRPLVIHGIEGDLLRLVHLSNTFEYFSGATPLRVGDTVTSQSQVQSITVGEAGKTVTVEAQILRAGNPVMKVISSFLFRGSFQDGAPGFSHTTEPAWKLELSSELDESVLLNRDWFQLSQDTPSLAGKLVVFNLETHVTYKHGKFISLHVSGNASCQVHGREWKEVGSVNFRCSDCIGNPVLDFLERRGTIGDTQTDFKVTGWSGPSSIEVEMPVSNQPYADISKDLNPIHVSAIFSTIAQLPGTLCHGMLTSAVSAAALEHLVFPEDRGRLRKFQTRFIGMVFPNEKLVIQLKHTGMINGRMKFTVDVTRKGNAETVLVAQAEIEQPATAYLFTGQGSQSKGMGMDLYGSSPVAKAVWDEIDRHLYETYGWSVLEIVQNNPKSHTVHFGGYRGRKIRQNYLSITTETVLPDGSISQQPVLAGLTPESTSYTFTDPRGLLYSTQFAQPAILTFEAAVFAELRAGGYVSPNAVYAGHSLGEYGALSALSQDIPMESLAELAFYRGLMMQASVAGHEGKDAFGMIAVNPARVDFNQAALDQVVRIIASKSGELLEIVNFNVDGEQYVCSGTKINLYVLGNLLDHLAESPDGAKLFDGMADVLHNASISLHKMIGDLFGHAKALPCPLELQRGIATIPLQGIDVPFHSSHLRSTVDRFRQCLLKPGFLEGNVNVQELVDRYIPNLIARPFSMDPDYIREAFELTRSSVLAEMLGGCP
ncbi:acyl transferase domain-containing protein [Aspergillus floccosus]